MKLAVIFETALWAGKEPTMKLKINMQYIMELKVLVFLP